MEREKNEACWLTAAELSRAIGRTTQQVRAMARHFPPDCIRERDPDTKRPKLFYAPSCILAWAQRVLPRQNGNGHVGSPSPPPAPEPDPLAQKRQVETQLAQLRLRAQSGEWMPRETIAELHNRMAQVLREGAKDLHRRFGDEAVDIYESMIESAMRESAHVLEQGAHGGRNGTTTRSGD